MPREVTSFLYAEKSNFNLSTLFNLCSQYPTLSLTVTCNLKQKFSFQVNKLYKDMAAILSLYSVMEPFLYYLYLYMVNMSLCFQGFETVNFKSHDICNINIYHNPVYI